MRGTPILICTTHIANTQLGVASRQRQVANADLCVANTQLHVAPHGVMWQKHGFHREDKCSDVCNTCGNTQLFAANARFHMAKR